MRNYIDVEELEETETIEDEGSKLMIIDDNHNTFEHVIETLVKICKHTHEQAEQCAHLIHHKGKCSVKEGSYEDLVPFRVAMTDRGIDARID